MTVMVRCLSLLIASLLQMVTSTTYYVIPDNYPLHNYTNSNTFTLQHYLNNTSKYFVSHNQLHFLPGQYYINSDLVFKEIYNFTLTGHGISQSVIICSSPASVVVTNTDNFTMQNIALIDCKSLFERSPNEFYVSVILGYCGSVTMKNIYVTVNTNVAKELIGISMINVDKSEIFHVQVKINVLTCHNDSVKINGLSVFYNRRVKVQSPFVMIVSFNYYSHNPCLQYSQCAIKCVVLTDFSV